MEYRLSQGESLAGGHFLFNLLGVGGSLRALLVNHGAQTAHKVLAHIEFFTVGSEAGHLGIDKLFAEELIGSHGGKNA